MTKQTTIDVIGRFDIVERSVNQRRDHYIARDRRTGERETFASYHAAEEFATESLDLVDGLARLSF